MEEATAAEEPEGETAEPSAEAAAACLRFAACVSDQHKASRRHSSHLTIDAF